MHHEPGDQDTKLAEAICLQLAKLGRADESHRYQLARLTRAHTRTRARLRVKVNDCEILRRVLIDGYGVTRDQIVAWLSGSVPMPAVDTSGDDVPY